MLYHLTAKVDFRLDPKFRPQNNTTMGGKWPEPGIFLTDSVEHWGNGYGYWQPWVVEFDVPGGVGQNFGRETFVPATEFDRLRMVRVIPLDAYCREVYGGWGWSESDLETTFDTFEPIGVKELNNYYLWRGYRYPGDARSTDPGWQDAYKKRIQKWRRTRTNAYAMVLKPKRASKPLDDALEELAKVLLDPANRWQGGGFDWGPKPERKEPDWASVLSGVSTIYRGYGLLMSPELATSDNKAETILRMLERRGGLGTHWTTHRGEAAGFAGMSAGVDQLRVIVWADPPSPGDVLTGDELNGLGVRPWDDSGYGEREIPIRPGAPLRIKRVEWAPGGPRPIMRSDDGGGWTGASVSMTKTAGPVRGFDLKDLVDGYLSINIVCKKNSSFGRNNGPYVAGGARRQYKKRPENIKAEIAALEREAKAQAQNAAQVIENMGGIDRIILTGQGNTKDQQLLAEKSDWSQPWGPPRKDAPGEYRPIEPFPTFYSTMLYGTDEDLLRVFIEDVAGGVYDDRQFAGIDEGKKVTVYRGITLAKGADPTSSIRPDGKGVGSSWTLSEDAAYAIAEKGQAGFGGVNARSNDVTWIRAKDADTMGKPGGTDSLRGGVPTVMRAEVVIAAEGASPYRPWSQTYVGEMEINIPRGTEFTMTGWRQAEGVPVNPSEKAKAMETWQKAQELERQQKYDDPAWMAGNNAGFYVRWQWGPWRNVNVKRTAVMLGTGETATTSSGRQTSPFPKVDLDSDRRTTNTLRRVDQWLVENARAEAEARGDRFNSRQFEHMDPKAMSQSDRDSAHLYLFDSIASLSYLPGGHLMGVESAVNELRRLASAGNQWYDTSTMMQTYPGLVEHKTIYSFDDGVGGGGSVMYAMAGEWIWVATGRDGIEGTGRSASEGEAKAEVENFLVQHNELAGQQVMFARKRADLLDDDRGLCEQCRSNPATVYAMGPYAGDWGGRYCQECADALGFTIQEKLTMTSKQAYQTGEYWSGPYWWLAWEGEYGDGYNWGVTEDSWGDKDIATGHASTYEEAMEQLQAAVEATGRPFSPAENHMTTTQATREATMNDPHREALLLEALQYATPAEAIRITAELDEIRASSRQRREADRALDWDAVESGVPSRVAARATALPEALAAVDAQYTPAEVRKQAQGEADRWLMATGNHLLDVPDELERQAIDYAGIWGSQFANSNLAVRAFTERVASRLATI